MALPSMVGGEHRSADWIEAPVEGFREFVGGEGLNQIALIQALGLRSFSQISELLLVVAVVDLHRRPVTDESMIVESIQSAHPPDSGVQPVSTSAPQFGHVATSMSPTMNENSHSEHSSFGDGGSAGGGGGGALG